jgi:hypothetical protein
VQPAPPLHPAPEDLVEVSADTRQSVVSGEPGGPTATAHGIQAAEIYIGAIAQTDNERLKARAWEKGLDPYEVMLTWLGSAMEDWGVDQALDRVLAKARATAGADTP